MHPCVGALDVAPVVHLDDDDRGAACAEALVAADLLARELELPVFLYGALAGGRTRAELRRGGLTELARRMRGRASCAPTSARLRRTAARASRWSPRGRRWSRSTSSWRRPATLEDARAIAARRSARAAPRACRACGRSGCELASARGVAQVSTNVEDHRAVPLADLVAAVRRHAPVAAAELVGLAPRAAFDGFPGRRPDPGLRPGAPPDRERAGPRWRPRLGFSAMAQTKRKRRSKHRGTAAGTIESRGRTGRKPRTARSAASGTGAATASARREARLDRRRPGAAPSTARVDRRRDLRSSCCCSSFKKPVAAGRSLSAFMVLIYIPMGYYTDLFLYRRRRQREGGKRPATRKDA